MSRTASVTVRLAPEIVERAKTQADKSGLTVSDEITLALQERFGLPQDPSLLLRAEIAKHVSAKYANGFPPDVILEVSRHIRDTPALKALYDKAILDTTGSIDKYRRQQINQMLGQCTKKAVKGHVRSRSLPLQTSDDLISTYSVLGRFPNVRRKNQAVTP